MLFSTTKGQEPKEDQRSKRHTHDRKRQSSTQEASADRADPVVVPHGGSSGRRVGGGAKERGASTVGVLSADVAPLQGGVHCRGLEGGDERGEGGVAVAVEAGEGHVEGPERVVVGAVLELESDDGLGSGGLTDLEHHRRGIVDF